MGLLWSIELGIDGVYVFDNQDKQLVGMIVVNNGLKKSHGIAFDLLACSRL